MLDLQAILGSETIAYFLAEHFQRLPRTGSYSWIDFGPEAIWNCIVRAVTANADVLICRRNERLCPPSPQSEAEMRDLAGQGYTFVVRHAEKHDERLAQLAKNFERDFAAPVNIHLYSTPPGEYGFGWHYDCEEVFIFQVAGDKTYELRKNTVHPWPVDESMPRDLHYEREIMPLWRCPLPAGDWLYIPSGYWHRATAGAASLSIALGLAPRTALDVWDFLRSEAAEDLFWRQRLPVMGAAGGDDASAPALRTLLASLRDKLDKRLSDPRLAAELARHFRATKTVSSPSETPHLRSQSAPSAADSNAGPIYRSDGECFPTSAPPRAHP